MSVRQSETATADSVSEVVNASRHVLAESYQSVDPSHLAIHTCSGARVMLMVPESRTRSSRWRTPRPPRWCTCPGTSRAGCSRYQSGRRAPSSGPAGRRSRWPPLRWLALLLGRSQPWLVRPVPGCGSMTRWWLTAQAVTNTSPTQATGIPTMRLRCATNRCL